MSIGTTRLKSRLATRADITAFFGKTPSQTVRARVLEVDDQIVGVAGYWLAGGVAVMFSDIRGDIPNLTIWRESKAMMQSMNIPALCIATAGSERFLERLGWHYVGPSSDGGVFQWS